MSWLSMTKRDYASELDRAWHMADALLHALPRRRKARFATRAPARRAGGVVLDGDGDPAIVAGGPEDAVRRQVAVAVSVTRRRRAVHGVLDQGVGENGHRRLPLGEVDVLPLASAGAMQERREDGDGAVEPARRIPVRDADVHGWKAAVAGDRGHAGERHLCRAVRDLVAVRSGGAVPRERDHDEIGSALAERLVPEPGPIHDSGREVLGDHVARRAEPARHLDRLGPLQIERDALLALVVLVEVAATVGARLHVGVRGK